VDEVLILYRKYKDLILLNKLYMDSLNSAQNLPVNYLRLPQVPSAEYISVGLIFSRGAGGRGCLLRSLLCYSFSLSLLSLSRWR
jgi:hypothetical protein